MKRWLFCFLSPSSRGSQLFNDLQKKAVSLVSENASALLTAGGVVGTVATAVLTGRAAFKAAEILSIEEQKVADINRVRSAEVQVDGEPKELASLTKTDKIKLVGVQFVPPVLVCGTTIAAIVMANRMSAQKAAALAAAYGISQKQLEEYKAKLQEKLTPKKYEEARAEIQQDRADANPVNTQRDVVIIGSGEVLCYDSYSDRYFKSSVENIRKAENVVHREIMLGNECSLQVFYDELDIPPTAVSKEVGWNLNHPCNVLIDAIVSDDKTPVIAIEFQELPIWSFDQETHPRNGY